MLKRVDGGVAAVSTLLLAGLFITFGGRINLNSGDVYLHYALVHEISRFGNVRPGNTALSVMLTYPPGSHWLAAIVGWIGGSDLVAIRLISIAATFISYFFAARLVEHGRGVSAAILFALLIAACSNTHSIVGQEVTVDFFYPQLVGDVAIFGFLSWLAYRNGNSSWAVAFATPLVGTALMWIQPISSIHVLGAGTALLGLLCLRSWRTDRFTATAYSTVFVVSVSAAIVRFHPMMGTMRGIAKNDGAIGLAAHLSDTAIVFVVASCITMGAVNQWRYFRSNGTRVDGVVGSAMLSACGIIILQYLALLIANEGSAYAVKKHLFLIVTLGLMNFVRLLAGAAWLLQARVNWNYSAPIVATIATTLIFGGGGVEMRPLLDALAFANNAASFAFSDFRAGNTVSVDLTMSPIANIIVSVSAFGYPMDQHRELPWLAGAAPENDAEYVMLRRPLEKHCPGPSVQSATFVIVETRCLKTYVPGEILSFKKGGLARRYARIGWSSAEEWGTWASQNGEVSLRLPAGSTGPYELIVDAQALLAPNHRDQAVKVFANGEQIAEWKFEGDIVLREKRATIRADLINDATIKINFVAQDATSPAQLRMSGDTRIMGIGISALRLK
jgi:hypothetical protein